MQVKTVRANDSWTTIGNRNTRPEAHTKAHESLTTIRLGDKTECALFLMALKKLGKTWLAETTADVIHIRLERMDFCPFHTVPNT